MSADTERLAWITWLKAAGMMLIVFGHVAAAAPAATLPPINTKQLGVAFFLFITGFTLTRERRRPAEVVFNRLFEVYVLGLALAVLISVAAYVSVGSIRRSNYFPFALGLNVFVDFFPANPTTWYVGTYTQMLLLWALAERRWKTAVYLPVITATEVAVRAMLLWFGVTFIAYMWLSNWATVYCLGRLAGRSAGAFAPRRAAALGAGLILLTYLLAPPLSLNFPFWLPISTGFAPLLRVSASITTMYAGAALLMFAVFRQVSFAPRIVDYIARHTLVIFLAHMPLYYLAVGPATAWLGGGWLRGVVLMGACTFIPAAASSLVSAMIDLKEARRKAWRRIEPALLTGHRHAASEVDLDAG